MIGDVARGRSLQIIWRDLSALAEDGCAVHERLIQVENELFAIEQALASETPPLYLRPDGELVEIPNSLVEV